MRRPCRLSQVKITLWFFLWHFPSEGYPNQTPSSLWKLAEETLKLCFNYRYMRWQRTGRVLQDQNSSEEPLETSSEEVKGGQAPRGPEEPL